ncbi:MAG: S26 family signal peptidase [Gemmatimonadota bacterium]|nr:S26 family signal peptidase [Gemmatimonadota bacterium]
MLDEPYVLHTEGASDFSAVSMLWQQEILVGGPRENYRSTRDTWGPLVIPDDRYFMLGDNRDASLDSRTWGLLERWRFEPAVPVHPRNTLEPDRNPSPMTVSGVALRPAAVSNTAGTGSPDPVGEWVLRRLEAALVPPSRAGIAGSVATPRVGGRGAQTHLPPNP